MNKDTSIKLTPNKLSLALALSLGLNQFAQAQFPNPLQLSSLNGDNGFVIHGENTRDRFGNSVSSAGDINGDGIDDLIIGVQLADPNNNTSSGSTYVVFGASSGLPSSFNLSSINGSNGFVIHGENTDDASGISVSAAGDINGDGIDDVIIGARGAGPNGNTYAGSSYVIFGKKQLIFSDGFE